MGDKKYKFLDDCTYDELKILEKELEQTLESRRDERFKELAEKVCEDWKTLAKEFPSLYVFCKGYCNECDRWGDILINSDQVFAPEDFSR